MRAFETEKTDVAEVDRSIYDIKDAANAAFEVSSGLRSWKRSVRKSTTRNGCASSA